MNKIAINQSASHQALWYLIVGASAAAVHFFVLVGVVSFSAISPTWANVIAFLMAFIVSFFGHFYLTFRANTVKKNHKLPILIKWLVSSAVGFLANQSLFVLGLNWFGELYYIVIWLVVTAVITVMTFVLGKLWAFKS